VAPGTRRALNAEGILDCVGPSRVLTVQLARLGGHRSASLVMGVPQALLFTCLAGQNTAQPQMATLAWPS
jgi:hypothetical protein